MNPDVKQTEFAIVGAGPTGIGAALRLLELGHRDFVLIDAADTPGGLASSFTDPQGFTWDLGGHVQFSHYRKFDEYMDLALPPEDWLWHERESWIWFKDRFIPYPFQNNLHRLAPEERWRSKRCSTPVGRLCGRSPATFVSGSWRHLARASPIFFCFPTTLKCGATRSIRWMRGGWGSG
jgi:protoporphyrinogen oxidase